MSKKKNKKITPPQKQASNSTDELVKENHVQKESTSWQKWETIINLIIALSSLVAIYISYDTAKKSLKNSEIANETSQQSLNVAQDANEISRQSLKAAQNVNEKSLKEIQEANEISQQSLKLAEISNRIQVLPIIQWHSETIDNIFSEWKKIDDINDSFNTDDYNINHFEPEGLVFINIGKPMSLQFSCEIVDVYSLLGIISVPTKPPMVFKHEWFIYDTRSHSKPSIFQIIQQDDNTNHLNDKLTIIFRQDIYKRKYEF